MPTLRGLTQLAQSGLIELEPMRPRTLAAAGAVSPEVRAASVGAAAAIAPVPTVEPPPPAPIPPAPRAEPPAETDGILGACPHLGFADDAHRHYARPTALHRCYATDPSSLVASQDQRELCLGGRYQTCPRFVPPPEEDTTQEPPVPSGVASRLALADTMSVANAEREEVPAWIGTDMTPTRAGRLTRRPVLERRLLLIAVGAVVGLALLVGVIAPPMLRPNAVQAPPTRAPAVVPTATAAPVRPTVAGVSATSPPRPTSVPTTPPRPPTPTAAPALPANVLADTRFAAGPARDWRDAQPFVLWQDGAYRLAARQATRFVAVAAPFDAPDDVVVSATLRKTGGPPGGGYGLIVRSQPSATLDGQNQNFDAYVLEAGDLGEFGIWRREDDHWVDLVPWTRSQAIRQGGSPNDLSVRAIGSQLVFTINGVEVARVEDDVLAHGGVGVFAGGDNNEVALDRFTVQVP